MVDLSAGGIMKTKLKLAFKLEFKEKALRTNLEKILKELESSINRIRESLQTAHKMKKSAISSNKSQI